MKSLGRIAYEQFCEESIEQQNEWLFIDQAERDAWDAAADAVVEEYERRQN